MPSLANPGGIRRSITATSGASRLTRSTSDGRVARLPDHLEAGVGEDPSQPFAQEHGVVGEDHPHASTVLTVVPPPSAG